MVVLYCGVVWCGVVWCGVVWCGVVWCGVVWCGVVWCGVVCGGQCLAIQGPPVVRQRSSTRASHPQYQCLDTTALVCYSHLNNKTWINICNTAELTSIIDSHNDYIRDIKSVLWW